jgi:hypothetical protein
MKINRENVLKIWKSKGQILEGIVNSVFKQEDIEEIAQERMAICESNICGLFDADGSSEKAAVKGSAACAGCGCKLEWKTRAMASYCYLKDMGDHPLWEAILSPAEADILQERLNRPTE